MTLIPAYGRDYTSAKKAKADFDANKDFIIADYSSPYDGKLVNREQLPKGATVTLRFKQLRNVTVFKV
jgi:hypothetical protein